MRTTAVSSFLAACVIVSMAGCIYTFNPKGKSDIKTLAVEPFDNRTSEYGLSDRLTTIVIDAFIKDGSMRIVPADKADAVLHGVLTGYARQVVAFDTTDQVSQYKVVLTCEVTLKTTKDDSTLWTQTMTQEGVYLAADETEEQGQQRAGEHLVEAVLTKTTKDW
ncbi:MAG: LptE family protein [candidate division Zixibacteria bacterium]|nr:LptE family protein [candidate division Zixibacteria bacterium]